MGVSNSKRLKSLAEENRKLKQRVAELTLDTQALKELTVILVTPKARCKVARFLRERLGLATSRSWGGPHPTRAGWGPHSAVPRSLDALCLRGPSATFGAESRATVEERPKAVALVEGSAHGLQPVGGVLPASTPAGRGGVEGADADVSCRVTVRKQTR